MSGDDDEEALTWAGARDPSLYETPEPKVTAPVRPAKTKSTAASAASAAAVNAEDADDTGVDDDEDLRPSMSSVMLICLGVLGGVYALYTIGWFVSWQRLVYIDPDVLELTAFRVQQATAIITPALWFGASLYFTRGRKPAIRLLWLVIGALVLIPWSFTLGR